MACRGSPYGYIHDFFSFVWGRARDGDKPSSIIYLSKLIHLLTNGSQKGAAKLRKKKRMFINMAIDTQGMTLRSVVPLGPLDGVAIDRCATDGCRSDAFERFAFHLLTLPPLSTDVVTRRLDGVVAATKYPSKLSDLSTAQRSSSILMRLVIVIEVFYLRNSDNRVKAADYMYR